MSESPAHKNAYDFSFTRIDGAAMPLSAYRGKVLLIVNTASQCGFTPQYEGLENLYNAYKDQGLVVIGVPSNDFGGQEPGSEAEIKSFCDREYKITFPMTQKASVVGDHAHPFYQWAADQGVGNFITERPRWNFHKYIVGRDGALKASYSSLTKPESETLRGDIIDALGKHP